MGMEIQISQITDVPTRDALRALQDVLGGSDVLSGGFRLYMLVVPGPVTNAEFRHTLGFTPKDLIVTRLSPGTASVTWHYDAFTKEKVIFSTTSACTIRFLLGAIG